MAVLNRKILNCHSQLFQFPPWFTVRRLRTIKQEEEEFGEEKIQNRWRLSRFSRFSQGEIGPRCVSWRSLPRSIARRGGQATMSMVQMMGVERRVKKITNRNGTRTLPPFPRSLDKSPPWFTFIDTERYTVIRRYTFYSLPGRRNDRPVNTPRLLAPRTFSNRSTIFRFSFVFFRLSIFPFASFFFGPRHFYCFFLLSIFRSLFFVFTFFSLFFFCF